MVATLPLEHGRALTQLEYASATPTEAGSPTRDSVT